MRLGKTPLLTVVAAVLMLLSVAVKPAFSDGLGLGDQAPALSIAEWVRGRPINLSRDAKKKIHVVEFWAVWCPPCKISVPLLTELQKKYAKNVVIVGVTEPDERGNSPSAIRRFVKEQGDKMDYAVAIDDGKTTQAYLAGAGVVGIPHAFVVDHGGHVVWQGSPLDPALDDVLGRIVAGQYDIKAAKLEEEINKRMEALGFRAQLGQWTAVWDGLLDVMKMDPANAAGMDALQGIALGELDNAAGYRDWARQHIESHRQNGLAMQRLADSLLSIGDLTLRMPDLALEAAKAAHQSGGGRDARAIVVYARALYQIGQLDRAIALQQDAVALALDGDRAVIHGTLEYYRKCKQLNTSVE